MKRLISCLAAPIVALVVAAESNAGMIRLTDPSQFTPPDVTAVYTGSDGTFVSSPYSLSAGGNTLTFTATSGIDFERVDEGNSWIGAFQPGTRLLWNLDSTGTNGGPNVIGFATGVTEAGLFVQQDHPVDTTFTATAYNGANAVLAFNVTVLNSGTGPGNVGFIGFRATGTDVITSIVISSADSVDRSYNNDFAMGPVTFGPAAVPEPSGIVLAGMATVCALALGRGHRRRASV